MSRIAFLGALVTLCLPLAVGAQSDVGYLRRQYEAVEARRAVVGTELREFRRRANNLFDDSVQIGARRVAYVRAQLTAEDLDRLRRVLDAESARLRAVFGAGAEALQDSARWTLESDRTRFKRRWLLKTTRRDGRAVHQTLAVPLDSAEVALMAKSVATSALAGLHPWFLRFAKGEVPLDSAGDAYAQAASALALRGSSVGERCLRGSLADCRTVVAPDWSRPALDLFYEPADYFGLARRAVRPSPDARSARNQQRARCLEEGDLEVCTALLRAANLGYPFPQDVLATFAVHAALLGGEGGVARAQAAGEEYAGDPLGFFAHVAGVPADTLLQSWQRSIVASREVASERPVWPLGLSSMVWIGLFGFVATRRRQV